MGFRPCFRKNISENTSPLCTSLHPHSYPWRLTFSIIAFPWHKNMWAAVSIQNTEQTETEFQADCQFARKRSKAHHMCLGGGTGVVFQNIQGYWGVLPFLVREAIKGSLWTGLIPPNIIPVCPSRTGRNVMVFALIDGGCKITDIHPDLGST